jgi:replicative DNA helicase
MPRHITSHLAELEQELASRGEVPELSLNMTPNLNKQVWGIKKRKLTLIASRTSQGKSAWSLQIAHDLSRQGHAVWLLSLEMTITETLERLFCHTHEVNNEDIMMGKFQKHKHRFEMYKEYCNSLNLIVTDCIGKTWEQIDNIVEGLATKPEVVIVDYIQNIKGSSQSQRANIDEYILHFREMAIRRNFAGIICSQINRAGQELDDKQPQLHQLKGSGALEEMPDCIWLLHWSHKYNQGISENEYQIYIAKNRGGRTGYVKMLYIPRHFLFKDHSEMELKRQEALNLGDTQ